jgi:HD-GYP domain-containing protein (c-di-GMP phosphodiesterase class II)
VETLESKVPRYGKSLIINFAILIKAASIYDSMNETILNMAKKLLDDIEKFLEESGEFTLKAIEGSFYIEGIRIKAGISDMEIFTFLAKEFRKKSIGMFDFKAPVSIEDLVHLAYAMKEGLEASEIQITLENRLAKGITVGGPVAMQKEEGIDLKDSYAVARRAYVKALLALMEMNNSIKTGTRVKLKKIKRALQLVIDSILTDESYLIAFTVTRDVDDYSYFHAVNVSILSVLVGKRIGFDKQHLRVLAIAALFHDIGKIEIPLTILNKKTDFSPKELEIIRRHPLDGITILLKSFGLSETLIFSMLVSFEHHMKLDLSGYPEVSDRRHLNLFSRIVSITDDYDSLVSGKVYERKTFKREDALRVMSDRSGTLYDPVLLKAFEGILNKT